VEPFPFATNYHTYIRVLFKNHYCILKFNKRQRLELTRGG